MDLSCTENVTVGIDTRQQPERVWDPWSHQQSFFKCKQKPSAFPSNLLFVTAFFQVRNIEGEVTARFVYLAFA
jgi:hypothetical protein